MKIWVLAGLFTAVAVPIAAADEGAIGCQVDDTRQQVQRVIADTESGSAPAPAIETAQTVSRPNVQRRQEIVTPSEERATQPQQRRRNGKRIPDAELIGPRGAL